MRPILFHLGDLAVPSLGVMLLLAFAAATLVAFGEMRRKGLDVSTLPAGAVATMVGAMVGARLYWALSHWTSFVADPIGTLFQTGGLGYYGGFFGAALALAAVLRLHHVPLGQAANCYAVAIPLAYMIARVGCFLAGDDYGKPTSVLWGLAFPLGSPPTTQPVHPTQLYEILLTLPVFLLLWSLRKRDLPGWLLLWLFCILAGLERFLVEFFRVNPPVALGWTAAQWISIGLLAGGAVGMTALRFRSGAARVMEKLPTPRRPQCATPASGEGSGFCS